MSADAAKSRFPLRFSVIFSVVFLILYWPGFIGQTRSNGVFQNVENSYQDRLFKTHADSLTPADPRIILVALDDDTGKVYGFPLPRARDGEIIDRLREYGVKTIMPDMMFLEDREGDDRLIEATRRSGRVIHQFTTEDKFVPGGRSYVITLPIKGLIAASQYLGYPNVDRVLDPDGHVRRAIFFDKRGRNPKGDGVAPSVDAVALASYLDKPLSEIRDEFGAPPDRVFYLKFRVPKRWLRHPIRDTRGQHKAVKVEDIYELSSPYQTISAMDVISGQLTPDQKKALKGALVVIGSTSLGYFDHYPTPFSSEAPGAEIHCATIDNALHGDFMKPLGRGWTALALLALIWLPLALLGFAPVVGAAVTAAVWLGWYLFVNWQFGRGARVDFIAPSVALVSSFLVQTVHRVLTEGAEKRFIKNLFGQFVAPEVVDDLAKDPGKVKLGGEKRDMTVFFLDIAHFTNISEKMPPETLIKFLNYYLSPLSAVVHEQKGVVDKYIGDCIMAFWNAPLELKDHRARACLAAIGCQAKMDELNAHLDGGIKPSEPPAIRIGVNSGDMTVGLTGSEKKLQYTVIGDEVNLASRLEGANKFFGSKIMASESTYQGAREAVEARELGRVRVVGKETPIRVYELLAPKGALNDDWRKALPFYQQGLELFNKRDYAHAVVAFQEVVKIFPKDGPANLYLNASKDYSAIPPQDDWDGVFNLTAK